MFLASHDWPADAIRVEVTDEVLSVELFDGRTVSAPLAWYPRLLHGTPAERQAWRLVGAGSGVHWPSLDEDVSVANLLAGRRSSESPKSLKRWLAGRPTPPAAGPPASA